MKTLYFDCSSGISGNMVLGALTEIIGNEQYLINELKKLNIDGYKIDISKKDKNGIYGTHVNVIVEGEDEYGHVHHIDGDDHTHHHSHGNHDYEHHHNYGDHDHGHHQDHENHDQVHHHDHEDHDHVHHHNHGDHDHGHHQDHEDHDHVHHHNHGDHNHGHHHDHVHRNLADVNAVIDNSSLNDDIKNLAKRIFLRVARAESKVHGKDLSEVHFHEVGAVDSIVDIVGTAILIDHISPDRVMSSVVNEGHGFIRCAHGLMSVPVPATSEIIADSNVIFRQIDIDTELVTPTGAAIIAELAESFGPLPQMSIKKIGWGAGTKNLMIPNVLKVCMGELEENKGNSDRNFDYDYDALNCIEDDVKTYNRDQEPFVVMETNIDDCSGEIMGYTMDRLLEEGALDVFFTPVYMKKNRPAYMITVTCYRKDILKLSAILFHETTTIGIRYRYEERMKLERKAVDIPTPFGTIKGKKVSFEGHSYIYPEYESAKKIAVSSGVPLKELYKQ